MFVAIGVWVSVAMVSLTGLLIMLIGVMVVFPHVHIVDKKLEFYAKNHLCMKELQAGEPSKPAQISCLQDQLDTVLFHGLVLFTSILDYNTVQKIVRT